MKARGWLSVVGVAILVFLLFKIDLQSLYSIISGLDAKWFIGSLLVIPIISALRGYRWQLVINSCNLDYPFIASTKGYLMGMGIGSLTPGRVGNFIRVPFLRKSTKASAARAAMTVFVDNILDAVLLFFVAGLGILVLVIKWKVDFVSTEWLLIMASNFLLLIIAVIFRKPLLRRMKHLLERVMFLIPERYRERLDRHRQEFNLVVKEMEHNHNLVIVAFLINLVNWAFVVVAGMMIAKSLGLGISSLFVFSVVSISAWVSALPISIFGLGTREATVIFLFAIIGIPPEVGLAYSLLVAFVTAWSLAILGALVWLTR